MPNRLEYRRKVGEVSGVHEVAIVTTGGSTGVTIDTWPIKSANDQDKLIEGAFLYRPATGEVRTVRVPDGYEPDTGTITPDVAWSPDVEVGEEIEIYGSLDPRVIHLLINDALKRCLLVDEFSIVAREQVRRLDLTSYAPWIRSRFDVKDVGWLDVNENREEWEPYDRRLRGDVKKIGSRIYWVGDRFYSSQQRIYFSAIKRHYEHCRVDENGTFGEQTGLDTDLAESDADVDWVAAGVMIGAWARFTAVMDATQNQRAMRTRQEAALWWSEVDGDNYQEPQCMIRGRLRQWGPRS